MNTRAWHTHSGDGLLGEIVQFLESFSAAMQVGAGDGSVGNKVWLLVALAAAGTSGVATQSLHSLHLDTK